MREFSLHSNKFSANRPPRLLQRSRFILPALLPAVIFVGCYAFVHDNTSPEFTPDPRDAKENVAGSGGNAGGPGAVVFSARCAVCHQMNGKGIPGVYPNLAGSKFATGTPEIPIRIVLHGFNGAIVRNGITYNGVMQPWQNDLSDQQIADVLTFVRSSWGNSAPAVDPALVKKIRESTKSKVGAMTEADMKSM